MQQIKTNDLLNIIAPNPKTTASVLANFKKVVKDGKLRLHPLVTQLVDQETLEKIGARPVEAADSPATGQVAH